MARLTKKEMETHVLLPRDLIADMKVEILNLACQTEDYDKARRLARLLLRAEYEAGDKLSNWKEYIPALAKHKEG